MMKMKTGSKYILPTGAALAVALMAAPAFAVFDGFGDVDRNNSGTITDYDTALDPLALPITPTGDTGIVWAATRGFTSSNTGDPKANIKIIDDSAGDIDSPGLQSGYALGVEGKGSGSSFAGFFDNPVALGPNVGDRVNVSFDWRGWGQSDNPTPFPAISELRWGIFQDTDNQFGQTANEGKDEGAGQLPVVWGPDTGENDGEWFNSDPGPVGDKGYWFRVPVGAASSAADARLIYEKNNDRFLEGSSVGCPTCGPGDQDTVASPTGDGPGGAIIDVYNPHTIMMSIVRTAVPGDILLEGYIDGVLVLADEVKLSSDEDVQFLGTPHDTFDYIALRNTGTFGDFDYVIDNVSVEAIAIPEPASLALLGLGGLAAFSRRR